MPNRGRGGMRGRPFVVNEGDADHDWSDVSSNFSTFSNTSEYHAPVMSDFEQKLSMCNELLNYLQRYLPKPDKNIKSKNKKDDNEADEHDYLSSSFFLTEEEEGYYYEKEQERRKQRKKKTKKVKKTLVHSTRMFTFFGLLETFPPTTLVDVPKSFEYIENYKEKLIREDEERRAKKEEERQQYEEQKEEEESIYSIPTSNPTFPSLHDSESHHDSDSRRDGDDVSVAFSDFRRDDDVISVANSESRRAENDVAMDEGEEELGGFDDLF